MRTQRVSGFLTLALLALPASAQDVSGGFGDELLVEEPFVGTDVFPGNPHAVGDLDEDGLADLAVPNIPDGMALFFGQPGGPVGPKVVVPFAPSLGLAHAFVADIDGDTHLDLALLATVGGSMAWARGHGDGSFDPSLSGGPGPQTTPEAILADVDGDGLADLLSAKTSLEWRKGDGAGGFAAPLDLGATTSPSDLLLTDLDADGAVDIAMLEDGRVVVRAGLGGGAYGAPQAWSSFADNGLQAHDADEDGVLDLVHGSTSNVATILHGLGDLQFGQPLIVAMPGGTADVAAADMDRDGVVDLVASSNAPSLIARRMAPDGPVGPAHVEPLGLLHVTHGLQLADFDGDGLPDASIGNFINLEVAVVENGLGPFIGLGHALPAPWGVPVLSVFGTPEAGQQVGVQVVGPSWPAAGLLFAGLEPVNLPLGGGLFVPDAGIALPVPQSGQLYLVGTWPASLPAGTAIYLQGWFAVGGGALASTDAWIIVSE